jgi:DNA replication initiation complex subunit (GINS family)
MADEAITFELIRRIQREEQRTQKLTKLPAGFYNNVQQYLESKRKMSNRKTALELKNAERLVEDIFNRRERKVLNNVLIAARTGIRAENMTDEEREFFNSVLSVVKERRSLLSSLKEKEKVGDQQSLIIFNEDVPEFVAVDEKSYGPFKKGDIAKLPGENMQLMIKQGVAEEFKVEK